MIRDTPKFKKYRVVAELDSGGMANVYLCATKGLAGVNKLHVLKQMRRELLENEGAVQMFLDEARLAARLNHPNVVQTHEVGEEDGRYYLAMEYLEGQSLAVVLRKHAKKLSLDLHLRVLCDALAGLHYAHELKDFDGKPLGVVHRDVSPQNVFITYAGQVKLLDFGIAKASSSQGKTQVGTLKGKIAFMAPEQVLNEGVDRRADVFAMGVMLWNAVAGRPMWSGHSEVTIVKRLCAGDIPTTESAGATVDEALDAIIKRALSVDPAKRYQSAAELRLELETYLSRRGAHVTAEDAGNLIQELFAEDRARVSKAIEEHMRRLAAEPDREHTPIAISKPPPPNTNTMGTGNGVAVTVASENPSPPKKGARVVALGGVLALVIAGGALAARHLLADRPVPTSTAMGGEDMEVEEVDVEIRATPAEAVLYLDGAPLGQNPYKGTRPRGVDPHLLRAVLPDGSSESRTIVFDKNVHVEVAIAASAPPPAATPTVPAKAAPTHVVQRTHTVVTPRPAPAPAPQPAAPAASPRPADTPAPVGKHPKPKPSLDKIDL